MMLSFCRGRITPIYNTVPFSYETQELGLIVQIRGEFEAAKKKLSPRKIREEYLEHPLPNVEIPADCHVLYTVLQINKTVPTIDVEGSRLAIVCPFRLNDKDIMEHEFI